MGRAEQRASLWMSSRDVSGGGETERETQRQRQRQRDSERERWRDRGRETEREGETEAEREMERWRARSTERPRPAGTRGVAWPQHKAMDREMSNFLGRKSDDFMGTPLPTTPPHTREGHCYSPDATSGRGRLREVKWAAQGHTAYACRLQHPCSHPLPLHPEGGSREGPSLERMTGPPETSPQFWGP